jgi:hypothetical protein
MAARVLLHRFQFEQMAGAQAKLGKPRLPVPRASPLTGYFSVIGVAGASDTSGLILICGPGSGFGGLMGLIGTAAH